MILAHGNVYELWLNHKNGWNQEAFRDRYNEVLDRYDYIVGDWGHNQLRLKGFFKANHSKATKETSIVSLQDYLYEYCNFGCAYFVLEKVQHKVTQTEDVPVEEEEADQEDNHPDQYQGDEGDDEEEDESYSQNRGQSNQADPKATNGANQRSSRRRRNRNRNRNKNRNQPSASDSSEG